MPCSALARRAALCRWLTYLHTHDLQRHHLPPHWPGNDVWNLFEAPLAVPIISLCSVMEHGALLGKHHIQTPNPGVCSLHQVSTLLSLNFILTVFSLRKRSAFLDANHADRTQLGFLLLAVPPWGPKLSSSCQAFCDTPCPQ